MRLTYKHVSGGERRYKVITRLSDGSVDDEGEEDEYVTADGEDDAETQTDGDDDRLPQFERRQNGGDPVAGVETRVAPRRRVAGRQGEIRRCRLDVVVGSSAPLIRPRVPSIRLFFSSRLTYLTRRVRSAYLIGVK